MLGPWRTIQSRRRVLDAIYGSIPLPQNALIDQDGNAITDEDGNPIDPPAFDGYSEPDPELEDVAIVVDNPGALPIDKKIRLKDLLRGHSDIIPMARVRYAAGTQSVGWWTVCDFDTEDFDTDNIWDAGGTTDHLTIQTPGKYLVYGHVAYSANNSGFFWLGFVLNDVSWIARLAHEGINTSGVGNRMSLVTVWDMNENDYVEMWMAKSTATSVNVLSQDYQSPIFGVARLG